MRARAAAVITIAALGLGGATVSANAASTGRLIANDDGLKAASAAPGTNVLMSSPVSAAADDSFSVRTTDSCHGGAANYIDAGDDVVVHDYCADHHGVMAYARRDDRQQPARRQRHRNPGAWIDGRYLGKKYNGNEASGSAVSWDPFGDVTPGHLVGLKVCLVDGANDTSPPTATRSP